ncbi:MAG: phosphoenolpyruvate--protein phosphotransferase [Planctomycetia bacterium]|nr:phosphoenolpyruvate--protein phosphotransferase [Planctomycetia bacterium]
MNPTLVGTPVSDGIAIARAVWITSSARQESSKTIPPEEVEKELARWEKTCREVTEHLQKQRNFAEKTSAEILEIYLEMLDDPEWNTEVCRQIQTCRKSVPAAISEVLRPWILEMESLEDDYARQRAEDLRALENLLQEILSSAAPMETIPQNEPFIAVGEEIPPVFLIGKRNSHLRGILSQRGGTTSHTAILAQTLGIPAVMGCDGLFGKVRTGDLLLLDGSEGKIWLHPDSSLQEMYRKRLVRKKMPDISTPPLPVAYQGRRISLKINAADLSAVEAVRQYQADGVGLFRSEFLFMSETPDEETQFLFYRQLLENVPGPVFIRTLDVGGDKPIPGISLPPETNPFLGMRGCRLYPLHFSLIFQQLRALLRASMNGNLRILFPMIISPDEVTFLRQLIFQVQESLEAESLPFQKNVPVGLMIETPAAVMMASELAAQVDFFNLGTNDLTQYTLAVDRNHPDVGKLYNPRHPAVLRMIERTLQAASEASIEVCLCGELAGEPEMVKILLEMGLNEWSVTPSKIPLIRETLRKYV